LGKGWKGGKRGESGGEQPSQHRRGGKCPGGPTRTASKIKGQDIVDLGVG